MADSFNGVAVPKDGVRILYAGGKYEVPDRPIVPFIEGDGTGRDIWKASVRVFDAAVEKAYNGKRRVVWYEIFAGEKAKAKFDNWLPDDTVGAVKEFRVAINLGIGLVHFLGGGVALENGAQHGCGAGTYGAVVQVDLVFGDQELTTHLGPVGIFVFVEQGMVG